MGEISFFFTWAFTFLALFFDYIAMNSFDVFYFFVNVVRLLYFVLFGRKKKNIPNEKK